VSRILLATWGSLGDLHPMIALALELRDRGHNIVFATTEDYYAKIESLGFPFHAIRPNLQDKDPEFLAQLMDPKIGTELVLRDLILGNVRDMYDDLMAIAKDVDFLVAHEIIYAAPLVTEVLKLRWASCVLAPASFFSAYDPMVSSVYPFLAKLRRFGPIVNRWIVKFAKSATRPWGEPVYQFRKELGLQAIQNPVIGSNKLSPYLVLAMFSSVLGTPQLDWPANVVPTGFTFYDGNQEQKLNPKLQSFLESGDLPIVFTLGSAAVTLAGNFYTESIQAALKLDRRAVLLMGQNPLPENLPASIFACDYAPYSEIFPCACAIVHQGGIGTTAQGLRSGRPTLVMPYSHDQPDNAARVERLGVSRTIQRHQYQSDRVAQELRKILEDPRYSAKAVEVSKIIQAEDGVNVACDAIEQQLSSSISQ
jgi:UDP:flavonoid glycosyltransferase YjiC (YdhE family)